jgi:hypothetical protein
VGVAAAVLAVGATAQAAAPQRTWHPAIRISPSVVTVANGLGSRGEALGTRTVIVSKRWRVQALVRHGFLAPWTTQWVSGPLAHVPGVTATMNDAGAAVAVWRYQGGAVQTAVRTTPTGVWRAWSVPAGAPNRGFTAATAAITANGHAAVLWQAHEARGTGVRGIMRTGTNARWQLTPTLYPTAPAGSSVDSISFATNGAGDAVAAWIVVPPGSHLGTVHVALRRANGSWTAPVTLANPPAPPGLIYSAQPAVAIAADGGVVVGWDAAPTTDLSTGQVVIDTANAHTGSWASPQVVAPGAQPSVAINTSGEIAAVWERWTGGFTSVINAAVRPPDGTWTTPQTVQSIGAQSEDYGNHYVKLGDSGLAVAGVSVHLGPGAYETYLATAGTNGTWSGAGKLTPGPNSTGFSTAIARSGDALALIQNFEEPYGVEEGTFAASYDAVRRPTITHSQWVWLRNVYIPNHYAPALRARVWTRLTANPSAALAVIHRYAPVGIR